MSKKYDKELMKLDLYDVLGVQLDADEAAINKSFRKKALSCHPDKNPDNPEAANQFDRLKKILNILLDPGARSAYDRVLKGRRAAAVRARETSSKSQKLRDDLEKREKAARLATVQSKLSEEERLRRELKRLEEEGERLIAQELEKINREVAFDIGNTEKNLKKEEKPNGAYRVKVRWNTTDQWPGYTEKEINFLFYKWGEINAIVMKQKGTRGTALVEYKQESGANFAVLYEKGAIGKAVEVTHAVSPSEKKETKKIEKLNSYKTSKDFESVAVMNQRREAERKRLIEEMMKNENAS